ncbi:MAG: histidine ammonia-lyase [Deltaproteobacteria bacterium]|nr:histidine ammonia-lyase [Deltaproteobacteria bacterium]
MIAIDGKSLTLETLEGIALDLSGRARVALPKKARAKMLRSRRFIEAKLAGEEPIYGVNTGFGLLSNIRVAEEKLEALQVNLLRSHAVGVGQPLSEREVRATIALRANTLAGGYSGVTPALVEALLALLNRGVHPWIPSQGSVGASGDLAPLAHLSLVLIGEGKAFHRGKLMPGARALKRAGLKPYALKPKEGLSLINGTQVMTAIGALTLLRAERLAGIADIAGAMSIEAVAGSAEPFDAAIHRARPHRGQIEVAARFRKLLAGSQIMKSHSHCEKIQDPYSFRCIPQVHGIVRDVLKHVRRVLEVEVNGATDNPLVFADGPRPRVVNAGNFHGEYVAIAMDELAIAVAELASISEQRLEKLVNTTFSDLPPFLVEEGGLNSGFMIVQVSAASLVSENKVLCHPASVDSIPTSADKEDHVSMGAIAARKARAVVENAWNVIAMELFAAGQGLEFRKPLRPALLVEKAYQSLRRRVASVLRDRAFHEDIEKISELMRSGELLS